jgi:hypothetical protein
MERMMGFTMKEKQTFLAVAGKPFCTDRRYSPPCGSSEPSSSSLLRV